MKKPIVDFVVNPSLADIAFGVALFGIPFSELKITAWHEVNFLSKQSE